MNNKYNACESGGNIASNDLRLGVRVYDNEQNDLRVGFRVYGTKKIKTYGTFGFN